MNNISTSGGLKSGRQSKKRDNGRQKRQKLQKTQEKNR